MNNTICLSVLILIVGAMVMGHVAASFDSPAQAAVVKPAGDVHPVDDDMHHFMEYVFEPNFKRLKAAMAEAPSEKPTWKAIKGDSLTIAECANLLLTRGPEENGDEWRTLAGKVRVHGGELYQAARKSDYVTARKSYVAMIRNCNICHQKFADGEHQLQP